MCPENALQAAVAVECFLGWQVVLFVNLNLGTSAKHRSHKFLFE